MTQGLFTEAVPITLEAHICDQRRSYLVGFATEAQAIEFVERKRGYQFHELATCPVSDELYRVMCPWADETCEHGLSAALCSGPIHY